MERRVVRHGPSTYTISLPSGWVKKYGVNKQDSLDVEEIEERLVLRTTKHTPAQTPVVLYPSPLLRRIITKLYEEGIDQIEIVGLTKEQFEKVEDVLTHLIGFEIVHQDEKKVIITSLTTVDKEKFDILFRRVFYLLNTQVDEGVEALRKGDEKSANRIILQDKQFNSTTSYAIRILRKSGSINEVAFTTLVLIERAADAFKHVLENETIDENNAMILRNYTRAVSSFCLSPNHINIQPVIDNFEILRNTSKKNLHEFIYLLIAVAELYYGKLTVGKNS